VLKSLYVKILPSNWIKCNSYDASSRVLGREACEGMFRSSQVEHMGSFADNLGIANAFRLS